MNKREYAQANKQWLAQKAQEEGINPLPKGIYYKVLATGKNDGVHPTPDGAFYIGEAYLGAITPLIEALVDADEE